MQKELELWRFIAARLERGENVMLLVVAESSGSSPGRPGYKMAVGADGELFGSIGGGVMEVNLVEESRRLLARGSAAAGESDLSVPPAAGEIDPSVPPAAAREADLSVPPAVAGGSWDQVHRKDAPNASGMICSGRQTVIFYQLTPRTNEQVSYILDSLLRGEGVFVEISGGRFDVGKNPPATAGGTDKPDLPAPAGGTDKPDLPAPAGGTDKTDPPATAGGTDKTDPPATADGTDKHDPPVTAGADDRITFVAAQTDFRYTELLGFRNHLYIIGGGHCALALSELMSKMDFHISLFDDRPELNTISKNEYAHDIKIIDSYERIGDHIASGPSAFVVVMTMGYQTDEVVIRSLIDKEFKYFGVLGSKAKMSTMFKSLREAGIPDKSLARLRTPIGLPINSRSPEEIAVSIAAEIISVKNG